MASQRKLSIDQTSLVLVFSIVQIIPENSSSADRIFHDMNINLLLCISNLCRPYADSKKAILMHRIRIAWCVLIENPRLASLDVGGVGDNVGAFVGEKIGLSVGEKVGRFVVHSFSVRSSVPGSFTSSKQQTSIEVLPNKTSALKTLGLMKLWAARHPTATATPVYSPTTQGSAIGSSSAQTCRHAMRSKVTGRESKRSVASQQVWQHATSEHSFSLIEKGIFTRNNRKPA